MTVQTLTIDELVVSDFNVRQHEEDATATSALEESIAAVGLYLPLVVHPLAKKVGRAKWGVLDGGRRSRAIRKLVDSGRLPRDWAIDCVVRDVDPARITELSLGAYLLGRGLHEYEVSAAVVKMLERGMEPEDIARNLGQEPQWVAQQLRLGGLEPAIFAAFARGEVSIDQARAYAATADQALQRAAFAHFADKSGWQSGPEYIRAWLKVGDRELARLLRFVGEDVYRAAGGTFELDLFAGEADQRGRVADEGKLRELVENKLGFVRQQLRIRTGRSDLRFAAEPPKSHGYTDHSLEITPVEDGDAIDLPQGEIFAQLEIVENGEVRTRWWWESRKAQAAARKTAREAGDTRAAAMARPGGPVSAGGGFDRYGEARLARAAVKDEHGLTADGLQVVRSLRRELLRALLVDDAGALGRDYIVWAQLRQELRHDRTAAVGARGLTSGGGYGSEDAEPRDVVAPHLEQCRAHAVWQRALGAIKAEPFIVLDDPAEALEAFVHASETTKNLAGAVLAGLALMRSANVPGWRIPAHDCLAALAGGDEPAELHDYWSASADFLALFPKLRRLEFAQHEQRAAGEPEETARFKALAAGKDADATREAAAILSARRWIHPILTFPAADTAVGLKEAAE